MSTHTFTNMLDKIMVSVAGKVGDDVMIFTAKDGSKFFFQHHQDCCEDVTIEDVCGDLDDLIGVPLRDAEEVDNLDTPTFKNGEPESYTWTFYRFGTIKGSVTVRWLGTSNGYYSEGVSYSELLKTS